MNRIIALLIAASSATIATAAPHHTGKAPMASQSQKNVIVVTPGKPLPSRYYPDCCTADGAEIYMAAMAGGPLYDADVSDYNGAYGFCQRELQEFEHTHADTHVPFKSYFMLSCMQIRMHLVSGASRIMLFTATKETPEVTPNP